MVSNGYGGTPSRSRSTSPSPAGRGLRVRAWVDAAISILFAPQCAACDRPLERPTEGTVCRSCWQAILPLTPPLCAQCGDPLPSWHTAKVFDRCARCLRMRHRVDRACAVGAYEGALRAIVQAFKYDGRRSLARPLGALMRERGATLLAASDVAVPVPLHRSRRRERGFNQAEDLAKHIGLPVVAALARIRRTEVQAELSAAKRHANVRGAFALTNQADRVRGRVVLLIDDVSTTGATLDACAEALRAERVQAVFALTVAKAATTRR